MAQPAVVTNDSGTDHTNLSFGQAFGTGHTVLIWITGQDDTNSGASCTDNRSAGSNSYVKIVRAHASVKNGTVTTGFIDLFVVHSTLSGGATTVTCYLRKTAADFELWGYEFDRQLYFDKAAVLNNQSTATTTMAGPKITPTYATSTLATAIYDTHNRRAISSPFVLGPWIQNGNGVAHASVTSVNVYQPIWTADQAPEDFAASIVAFRDTSALVDLPGPPSNLSSVVK